MSGSATGWRGVFGADTRSLALWRVGLGLLVLYEAVERTRSSALLVAGGVMPMDMVPWRRLHRSLLFWSDAPEVVAGVVALLGLAGLALVLGWRTRAAGFVAWVLVASLQARNPTALSGADTLLRLMLFWSLFLPTNGLLSLDRAAGRTPLVPPATIVTAGSVAYLLQIGALYVVTGLLKSGAPWHDGTALHDALHLDQLVDPLGVWARDRAWLTVPLTHATWWLEVAGPALLLVPVAFGPVRAAVVAAFLALHVGIEAMMDIGPFPVTSIVCWMPLIPGWVWDRLRWPVVDGGRGAVGWWSWAWQGLAADAMVVMVWWNLGSLVPEAGPPQVVRRVAMTLRLDQRWDMFAPRPKTDDGWYVFAGRTADGRVLEVFRPGGGERTFAKPADIPSTFPAERWRKYLERLTEDGLAELRPPLLRWMCEDWNDRASAEDRVDAIAWFWMLEPTPRIGAAAQEVRRIKLAAAPCP